MITEVSIVIVNWNQKDLLKKCISSIYAETTQTNIEIIVVDNHSEDDSVAMLHVKFPNVQIIENQENVGFGRANNLAFQRAKGKYILLVNNDVTIPADTHAIDNMAAFLDAHPEIGIAGPKILHPRGAIEPSCGNINFHTQFSWEIFPFYHPIYHWLWRLRYAKGNHPREVEAVTGAFLLFRKEVLESIGGFDMFYFLYCEEIDWCKRAVDKGVRVFYLPQFYVHHLRSASAGGENLVRSLFEYYKSKNYFAKKFWPGWKARLLSLCMYSGVIFRYLGWSAFFILGIRHEKAELMKEVLQYTIKRRKETFLF